MVAFERQIYFAQMEWGDESNKQWFKSSNPQFIQYNLQHLLCFRYSKVVQSEQCFSSPLVKATGAVGLFPCFFSCFCLD